MNSQILIADDHRLLREGLKSLLQQEGFPVVAEADDGRTAVRLAMELKPAIVLTDIRIPGLNGIEITRQIHRDCLCSRSWCFRCIAKAGLYWAPSRRALGDTWSKIPGSRR